MALNPLVDSRDMRFTLFEMLEIDKLTDLPKFSDFDRDMFEDTLTLAENIAVEEVYPVNAEADKEGVQYNPDTKEVTVPECIKPGLAAFYEAGFLGIATEQEIGGMGMPVTIYQACVEYFTAASMTFTMYTGLSIGALNLIKNFGTDEQKKLYIEKMLNGQWGGSMCLTEPEAGSDVGALKTKAVLQDDGTYLITGQKIFISSGDSNVYENMIHPVLARIEGDPAGTKGISIFIVPKYRVNPDGTLGEFNDVICTGIEHKMGIKASPTCSLSFGDEGKCVGYLLGQPQKGMRIMFQMMNEARLYVGLQGLALSSAAYMHAVTYAKNRVQGRHATQMTNREAPSVTIIQHPDIKRMLLWMKSYVEGMRMLSYYVSKNIDLADELEGDEAKECLGIVELLIPITKAGCTDSAWLITAEAIQIYGGYGYCSDYPVEQFARDSKILSLYEGTNGIQSMDLTMRKILMNPDHYNYSVFRKRVAETVAQAKGVVDEKYVTPIEKALEKLDEVIEMMKGQMGEMKILHLFMNATPLQQAMFMLALAWMHLWSLTLALPKMKELVGDASGEAREKILKENLEAAFYSGKVLAAQFYIGAEFKKCLGKLDYILDGETAVLEASEDIFTGALEE